MNEQANRIITGQQRGIDPNELSTWTATVGVAVAIGAIIGPKLPPYTGD